MQTASQGNITSLGTLTGLTSSGTVSITNNTDSTSTTSGALKIIGGVGIGGTTNIGGALTVTGNINGTLATVSQPNITTLAGVTSIGASSSTTLTGTLQTASQGNITSLGTLTGLTSSGAVSITNNTDSTSKTTGALKITGGVGVGGNLYANYIYAPAIGSGTLICANISTTTFAATGTAAVTISGSMSLQSNLSVAGSLTATGTAYLNGSASTYVGAGWGYHSNGEYSIGGGTVPLSLKTLYCSHFQGTLYVTSDERLKKNIKVLETEEIMKILELTPIEYDWKNEVFGSSKCFGFSAQETMKILPRLVDLVENEDMKEVKNEEGRVIIPDKCQLVMPLQNLIPYLLGVLKIQQKQIKTLEDKLNRNNIV